MLNTKVHYGKGDTIISKGYGKLVVHRYTADGNWDRSLGYEGIAAACTTPEAQEAALRLLRVGTCPECGDARKVIEKWVPGKFGRDPIYRPCSLCWMELI